MAMAMVNIRIDEKLKADGDAVFRELNVSATEAITRLYRYAVEYRKLPFNDVRLILFQMKDAVDKAADLATKLNIHLIQKSFISVADRDAARDFFNGTIRSLEDSYPALQSACGGYLDKSWVDAANAMKGLLWMLTMCTEKVSEGLIVNAEVNKAAQSLSDSYISISLLTEQFVHRN